MKKYLNAYPVVVISLSIVFLFQSCTSSTPKENKQHEESNTTTDIRSSKRIGSAILSQKATFPNMPFKELINLTKEPMQQADLLVAPLLNTTIKFDQEQAKSNSEGLTYTLENYVNFTTSSRAAFIASKKAPQVNLHLNTANGQDVGLPKVQLTVDPKAYMIDKTGKTKVIAGITCQQAIYNKINRQDTILPKFVIWKSPRIPKGINLLYPYIFKENEGILEIDAYLSADENSLIRYTTTSVVEKQFEPGDFDIPTSNAKVDLQSNSVKLENQIWDLIKY